MTIRPVVLATLGALALGACVVAPQRVAAPPARVVVPPPGYGTPRADPYCAEERQEARTADRIADRERREARFGGPRQDYEARAARAEANRQAGQAARAC